MGTERTVFKEGGREMTANPVEVEEVQELGEIVKDWLKKHGYSGLYNDDCGCSLAELMPCDEPHPDCIAGYLIPCKPDGEWDFIVGPNKLKEESR